MAGRGCHEAAGSAFFLFRSGQVHRPRPQNGESGYGLGELERSTGGLVLQAPPRSGARSRPRQARRGAGSGRFLPSAAGRRGDVAAPVEEEGSGARGSPDWAEVMEKPRRPWNLVARAPSAAGRTCHWQAPGGGGRSRQLPAARREVPAPPLRGPAGTRAPSALSSLGEQRLCPPGARAAQGCSPGTLGDRPVLWGALVVGSEGVADSRGGGGGAVTRSAPDDTPGFPLADRSPEKGAFHSQRR